MDNTSGDKYGRQWAIGNKVKAGDRLFTDSSFTCMPGDELKVVRKDEQGLYVACWHGRHYLDGQLDGQGRFVGFYR